MKKIALVVIVLASACLVFGNGLSESIYTGQSTNSVWTVKFFIDEFGNDTGEQYITTIEPIQGSFTESSLNIKSKPVEVHLIIIKGIAVIEMYEDGEIIKWPYRENELRIKDGMLNIYTHRITPIISNRYDLFGNAWNDLIQSLSVVGKTSFSISLTFNRAYSFTVDTAGFKELYESTFSSPAQNPAQSAWIL